MAERIFILLVLWMFLAGSAAAEHKVLAIQSISVAPYEQAIQGFERVYGSEVKRLLISDPKEKDLLKALRETRPDLVLAVGRDALLIARRIATIPVSELDCAHVLPPCGECALRHATSRLARWMCSPRPMSCSSSSQSPATGSTRPRSQDTTVRRSSSE